MFPRAAKIHATTLLLATFTEATWI